MMTLFVVLILSIISEATKLVHIKLKYARKRMKYLKFFAQIQIYRKFE